MMKECCDLCDDGDGFCVFPIYGVAPHDCFYMLGTAPGTSREKPESEWPENFVLDPDSGPWTGYPRAGVYTHYPSCGAGLSEFQVNSK